MRVLVTGGTGYIGSHAILRLIENGYSPLIVDSLVNNSRGVLGLLGTLTVSVFI